MTGDPLIGRQVANYRIERLIGRGGMASVYYATDIRLNRPAAVKVIDAHFREKEAYAARFVQEARTVAAWRHEHIVQIYYAGDEDGLYYFAMEYIDGKTLAQVLSDQASQGGFLPVAEVLRYGRAIASALDYAHGKGVIHRDVKPLNVLVASDGRVVLTDFGLALDTSQGSLGEVFGTAHYTAPEQARRSNAAVTQSDLYSLGVILYEMLTGVVPFDDPSPTSVALQHITLPPPSPCQVNPRLNPAVEPVLLKALAKDPVERFPSGEALMDALGTAFQASPQPMSSLPLALEPSPALPQASHAGRSTGWLLWLGAAVFLCLGISLVAAIVIANFGQGKQPASLKLTLTSSPSAVPVSLPFTTSSLAASTQVSLPSASLTATSPASAKPPAISPTPIHATATSLPGNESMTLSPTLPPSLTSVPLTPTPTLKYTDRRRFVMYYNETSFYMIQLSGVGDLIAGVNFERLDANGKVRNRFSGNRWAKYSPSSVLNACFRLEISGAGNYLRPLACEGKYMASLNPEPNDPGIFWTPEEGSMVFQVLWQNEELVRCEIAAGTCEVYLP